MQREKAALQTEVDRITEQDNDDEATVKEQRQWMQQILDAQLKCDVLHKLQVSFCCIFLQVLTKVLLLCSHSRCRTFRKAMVSMPLAFILESSSRWRFDIQVLETEILA